MRSFAKAFTALATTVLLASGCSTQSQPNADHPKDADWQRVEKAWNKAKEKGERAAQDRRTKEALDRAKRELDTLVAEAQAEANSTAGAPYDRSRFGSDWPDVDGNSCNTRDDILARDLTDLVIDGDQCTVLFGTLEDPYTGTTIHFERGHSAVDIDHVVALEAAWLMGADSWTDARRTEFANDPENLMASSAFNIELANGEELRGNRSKGARTLSEWMPDNPAFHCHYASQFMLVAQKYHLSVAPADARVAQEAC